MARKKRVTLKESAEVMLRKKAANSAKAAMVKPTKKQQPKKAPKAKRGRNAKKTRPPRKIIAKPDPPELTDKEFMDKKLELVRRAILAEREFKKLLPICKKEKLAMIKTKKRAVLKGTSEEYLMKMKIKEDKFKSKTMVNETQRNLEMDALDREMKAMDFANPDIEGDRFAQILMDQLKEKRLKLLLENRYPPILLYAKYLNQSIDEPDLPPPLVDDITKEMAKKLFKGQKLPLIDDRLDDKPLEEDLAYFEECIRQADERTQALKIDEGKEITVTEKSIEPSKKSGGLEAGGEKTLSKIKKKKE